MLILRVFICLLFFMLMPVVSFAGCHPGDHCSIPSGPCKSRTDFFGSTYAEGVAFNYDYYDAVFVAELLGFPEEQEQRRIATLKMKELIKDDLGLKANNYDVFNFDIISRNRTWLSQQKYKFFGNKYDRKEKLPEIERLLANGTVKKEHVCSNRVNPYSKKMKNRELLFFIKKLPDYKNPIVIRMVPVDEHSFDATSHVSVEADLVFVGIQTKMETQKEPVHHKIRDIEVVDVLKSNEAIELGPASFKTFFHCRKSGCSQTLNYSLDYDLKKQKIFYMKKNNEHQGYYDIIYVSADMNTELKLFRKVKAQE